MTLYTCPMHPEIKQDHPGKCPKCGGMDLVPKESPAESAPASHEHEASCHAPKHHMDYLLWGTLAIIAVAYAIVLMRSTYLDLPLSAQTFTKTIHDLMNQMAWGIALGMLFVGVLAQIPRDIITSLLGRGGTFSGIARATAAGVLLDLCSHGILMVGAQLYRRGASLGQVMAFLIASPWNSLSLTLILWALVGFKWMFALLLLSMGIGFLSGLLFDQLVARGILPKNQATLDGGNHDHCSVWKHILGSWKRIRWTPELFFRIGKTSLTESKMVLRWIFFGTILAALIRTFVDTGIFATYFGPSLVGLGLTVVVATILEVCSEGSLPIAADLLLRAKAPGNAFAFLMTGVSTDYTEIMILKDTTKSWKIAFFLPLVTVPQVLAIAYLLNQFSL